MSPNTTERHSLQIQRHFDHSVQALWRALTEGEVLEVQPGVRLVYRMHTQGAAPDGVTTVVTWTLRPTAQGTMLHLEQTGFRPQDEPNFRGAGVVWLRYLERLGHLVNTDTG
ncbi:SRPBCC domain-containing protein [Deinococcus sp.]|uniref:SRPBCC family protein n=1 Tax=Deinococcus sp. TaxID=47478 RepID=UPI002869826D|nr:SRPBCC domain-containing protein [Deinococcus sp.]